MEAPPTGRMRRNGRSPEGHRGSRSDDWVIRSIEGDRSVFGGYTESDALWGTAHPQRSRYFNLPRTPVSSVGAPRRRARAAIPNQGWGRRKRNLARFLSFTIDFQLLHYTLRSFAAPHLAPLQRLRLHDAIPSAMAIRRGSSVPAGSRRSSPVDLRRRDRPDRVPCPRAALP